MIDNADLKVQRVWNQREVFVQGNHEKAELWSFCRQKVPIFEGIECSQTVPVVQVGGFECYLAADEAQRGSPGLGAVAFQ